MKPRLLSTARLSFPLAAALAALLAAQSASATSLYWDTNGTGSTGSGAATGTWGTDAFWSTDSTGLNVGSPVLIAPTTNIDDLFFSAGTNGTGGTVTVNGARSARKLTFEEGAITLSGGTSITLAGGGGLTVDAGAGDAIVSTALIANGNNTFNVGAGRTLTLDTGAFTRGTRATLNIQGTGTVTSTKTGLATGDMVNGIIGPWASFGTGSSTKYATFSGNNITGLTGTAAATAADVTSTLGSVNYDVAAVGTLGASASINTLRYTGTAGTIAGGLITKGIMNVGGGTLVFSGAVTAGSGAVAGTSTTELVFNTASGDITFNGLLTGAINKTGSGTMTLGGAVDHNIGQITVNEGILITNRLTDGGMTGVVSINSGGTLRMGVSSRHGNASVFTINAGGTLDLNDKSDLIGGITGAGLVTNNGSATSTLELGNTTQTFSGVISGSLNLRKRNGGDQILTGANTFTGTTAITNVGTTATLTLGNSLALQNSALDTTTSVAGTTTTGLRTTVTTLTFGGLTGNKNLASVFRQDASGGAGGTTALGGYSGVTALTLNPAVSVTHTYAAVIADGAAGMTLAKSGAGTQELTGANTYTGATTISGGTLKLSGSGKLGSGTYAGGMSIANGATFENASSGTQTLNGAITGAGTLTNSGGGGLVLTNAGNSFGALSISNASSRVFINNATALPAAATVNIASGALVFGASATRANAITVASGGTLSARAATTLSNVTLPGSGSVIFNNDDSNTNLLTISNNQTLTGALTVQVGGTRMLATGGSIGTVDLSGNIDGEGSLVMTSLGNVSNPNNGTGKLILSGTNTYTGATLVSSGTLFVTGSLTSDVSVSDAATLGGGGTVAAVSFAGGSYFDIALAVGSLDSLASTTISFASTGFGIDNLRYNGAAVDWSSIADNTYTLISGDLTETNLGNFGLANAFDIGGGRSAYFTEGSLQLVVIPEPGVALLGGLGLLALLRRRR